MRRVQFTLTGDNEMLADGYEADRNIPLHDLARSALLSAIKREVGRGGLLAATREIVRREVADALAGHRASAQGHRLPASEGGTTG